MMVDRTNLRAPAVALVAEDELFLRMETASILEDAGYVVFEAADAAQALDLLAANSDIMLLLTDIQMPGALDGIGLAHAVRRDWPDVEIVVVSALKRPKDGELPNGVSFIDKPYDARAILAMAQDVSARRDVRAT